VSAPPDVAVVGGGIVGCALAAFCAEAGASVRLYERDRIAAGASGRNSGLLQHPLDGELVALYQESLRHYRELEGFDLPPEPVGLLLVSPDRDALAAEAGDLSEHFPELAPELLDDAAAVEPCVAPGMAGARLPIGHPVPPAAATEAFAARARAAGADLRVGEAATAVVEDGRAAGVRVGGALEPAGAVVVAAGPWTPAALDGAATVPVGPLWGVIAEVALERPPTHAIEEAGSAVLTGPAGTPPSLFTIVTARGVSSVGSAFLADEPDHAALAAQLLERGARYVPALAGIAPRATRACARPQSADGRPLLGPVPGVAGLALATGHGPWGITLGPASARLVADGLLGRAAEVPPALAVAR
jgi:glycine/D-amino acid oxidase-like deaminating enzyme